MYLFVYLAPSRFTGDEELSERLSNIVERMLIAEKEAEMETTMLEENQRLLAEQEEAEIEEEERGLEEEEEAEAMQVAAEKRWLAAQLAGQESGQVEQNRRREPDILEARRLAKEEDNLEEAGMMEKRRLAYQSVMEEADTVEGKRLLDDQVMEARRLAGEDCVCSYYYDKSSFCFFVCNVG